MNNFEFLKRIDKNLYNIISEAEKLYRDEYFEQCIVQTRKFGENVCKNVIGTRCTPESTFDEMLATLKDKIKIEQEKEFIDDLYFLKKQGNASVHSSNVKKEGMLALECLQRAFEVAINYVVYYAKGSSNILKLRYDIDLLVTGEKSKKTLSEKYKEGRKTDKSNSGVKKSGKQSYTMKSKSTKKKEGLSFFQILLIISSIISVLIILFLL